MLCSGPFVLRESDLGKGEGELGEAILAGDGDVFLVGVEDGFDDVQAQPHAVLVGGAGGVGLVETVENVGELLGGDGLPFVADGDVRLAGLGIDF